jgi:threonine synthase
MEVRYDPAAVDRAALAGLGRLSRYVSALPTGADLRSLGEGGTPLLRIDALNRRLGFPNLWVKLESCNPTGSFKDRLHAVGMSMARQCGFGNAALGSTGNSGVAACAYGALNDVSVSVRMHPDAPSDSRSRVLRLGGELGVVEADGVAWWPSTLLGTFAGLSNPYGVEGYKTIAYELAAELGGSPDRVLVPVSGGDAIYGPWKGFRELRDWGLVDRLPRMVACQTVGADFAVRTLRDDLNSMAVVEPSTAALSIGDPTGSECIRTAVQQSGGCAFAIDDADAVAAQAWLAECGLLVELASAVPLGVLVGLVATGGIDRAETVVMVVTSGWKNP